MESVKKLRENHKVQGEEIPECEARSVAEFVVWLP
jgi:hypothetical protein